MTVKAETWPPQTEQVSDLVARLQQIVGSHHVIANAQDMAAYLSEPRDLFIGKALCVVLPGTTLEVAAVLKLCFETSVSIVPQGGNTGLVGGQIPDATGRQILLSLRRMTKLREIDLSSNTMIVEAGMTLAKVQEEAHAVERLFPLSLASEGSCTIGGNLATNAGGTAVLAYGNARDLVLGLEVVLADGRILHNLSKLKKDNTGYDLKHIFMGSEGTLGIITAACLKLFPMLASIETAFVGLASPQKAIDLLALVQRNAGDKLKTFELIPRIGLDFVLAHSEGPRDPLAQKHQWYVLIELGSQQLEGLRDSFLSLLESASEKAILEDASIATSLVQRQAFWALRERLSDVQKLEGGSIKHDVSVPISAIPAFLEEVETALQKAMPGARLCAFGHVGDGNIHCNVSQPLSADMAVDKARFLARWDEVNEIVHAIVIKYHGSISAEHGIGVLKRNLLVEVKDPVALAVMRAVKQALDPAGILNPGKVL
jgi:FAD/FMN-containing dehydrogenase